MGERERVFSMLAAGVVVDKSNYSINATITVGPQCLLCCRIVCERFITLSVSCYNLLLYCIKIDKSVFM